MKQGQHKRKDSKSSPGKFEFKFPSQNQQQGPPPYVMGDDNDNMEEAKKNRTKLKSLVTRLESKIARFIAEDDANATESCLNELMTCFKSFENAHQKYHVMLESDLDIVESDEYLIEVQDKYSDTMKNTKKWLLTSALHSNKQDSMGGAESRPVDCNYSEMYAMLNMPKVELDKYDGDPLKFHSFMAIFDETVDKVTTDSQSKLTRLLQYTTGIAKDTIQPYAMIGGSRGYDLARQSLFMKFGDSLLISEKVIAKLKDGQPINSSSDLEVLSNDLKNCSITLSLTSNASELDSQRFIASIVNRLQIHHMNKWKKIAMNLRCDDGRYPVFTDLVKFIERESRIAADPVYGDHGLLESSSKPSTNPAVHSSAASSDLSNQTSNEIPIHATSYMSSQHQVQGRKYHLCVMCHGHHRLYMCNCFKALTPEQKLKTINTHKVCENCLLSNHQVNQCTKSSRCGIHGCQEKHSRLIHSRKTTKDQNHVIVNAFTDISTNVCVPIVKVKINQNNHGSAL